MVESVKKRDGRIVKFDVKKISQAIYKALLSINRDEWERAEELAEKVVFLIEENFPGEIIGVETIQDLVEKVLVENNEPEVVKHYILYREKKKELRESKFLIGVKDDLKLPFNSLKVLESRYLLKNSQGKVIETPKQLFQRVAHNVALADLKHHQEAKKSEKEFFEMMVNFEFLPNSPTLMNAGTPIQQLSACFVLPIHDSIESIFTTLKNTAIIHKTGGGTGFDFSHLRPKGDIVALTGGIASGPVSFMKIFDAATEQIKQGGKRRGANMGILRIDHSDILEFIMCKEKEKQINNFNLSVAVTDKFMTAVMNDEEYELINPRNKEVVGKLNAGHVFNLMATMAWRNGDPGIIFIDRINKDNPTPLSGKIESTNPCGEQPLLPYESCNLGSINLAKFVENKEINWQKLRETIHKSIHFLDNVVDMNKYPLPEIAQTTLANRKIGLGVMGWADCLIKLEVPYNSKEALEWAEKVMKFIDEEAKKASCELAKVRSPFPNFRGSIYDTKKPEDIVRNATRTTIAPTGTISIIANCSSGIEPLYALAYLRKTPQFEFMEINPLFEEIAKREGFYSEELVRKVSQQGNLKGIKGVPEKWREIFVTALEIKPEDHVKMQAAFQKYTNNAVSKTVNLPYEATIGDIIEIYLLAWKLGCKGITVYRDRSREEQVLNIPLAHKKKREAREKENLSPKNGEEIPAGSCPKCHL